MWPSVGSSGLRYAPLRTVASTRIEEKMGEKQGVVISD